MTELQPWSHACSAGFTLRGWHSPPRGRPVLHFLHGNGFCGLTYAPLLSRLAEDFDLFLSDAQGHGESDHGGRFHGWNRSADLAIEAWHAHAARFGDVPVHGCGHSFGGVLTALMCARAPQLFQRTVLLDPVLFPPAMIGIMALSDVVGLYARNTLASRARKRRREWPDRDAARASLRGRGMFRGWSEDALEAYVEHALREHNGKVELRCAPTREAEIFGSFPRRLWSSLARVRTPTCVLVGTDTFPFVAKGVARWRAIAPCVTTAVVPGGHCFMQEDAVATAANVRAFLLTGTY